ncbi:serine hydrolase domain-containing protein [Halomonas denitrificans]|nr:beta-lactamase family protein [Halomonas denitrificans]
MSTERMQRQTLRMTLLRHAMVISMLFLAEPSVAASRSPESAPGTVDRAAVRTQDRTARIDTALAPFVASGDFMGVVAYRYDGQAPVIRSYGLAQVELGVRHRPDGIFGIGSISKQVTAVAVLLLEQDGALAVDDPVARYLPEFKPDDDIRIEQLLVHTAGVADIYDLESFGRSGGAVGRFAEVIDELAARPLTHAPGTTYAYSNGGYAVLAAVIERVSGMTYAEFTERRIAKPLGLRTLRQIGPDARTGRVSGYDPHGIDGLQPARRPATAFLVGSGSLETDAEDLLAWTSAIHSGRLLSASAYGRFTRDHGHAYGYGISVFRRFDRPAIGHDGRVAGFSSDAVRYPDDGLSVVVLGNVQSVARDDIRRIVAAAALDVEIDAGVPPADLRPVPASIELEALEGAFGFGPNLTVYIDVRDREVFARANRGAETQLVYRGDGRWFSRVLYATVRFGRDADGRVDRLIWGEAEDAPAGLRLAEGP